jgi:hypothetical protein
MELTGEDPEPPDENDPEFRLEIWDLFHCLGVSPNDIRDPEYAEAYAKWLLSLSPE